jgi:putative aldouronate transport system substrate-binding protein
VGLNANVAANYTNLGDTPLGRELQKRTGVKINFLHPPANAAQESFNLMIAAQDELPDIIEWDWARAYPGGPEKAMGDGVIINLNNAISQWAPNLQKVLAGHPQWDRLVKTDNGNYYVFPDIRGDELLLYSQGLMIRKDWLDELGLKPPATMQEWHDMLTAFKEKKGASAPFTQAWSNNARMFMPGYNFLKGMYISARDGKVHFGQFEPNYRQWISAMAQWYKEGLIDKDILSVNTSIQNAKMTNGASGATVASVGSGMGTWTAAARAGTPKYEIIAVQYPAVNKGDKLLYSIPNQVYNAQNAAAITANCKNVEIAARYLDYGYSQEGHLLYNFGIEGTSYTMVNGAPVFIPQALHNAQGWPIAQSLSAFVRSTGAGPFVQDKSYILQYYEAPEQKAALNAFVLPGAGAYWLPPLTPTPEESREYAAIINEINTYVDEQTSRWLLGTDPVNDSTWNNYISTIQRLNISRAIAIQQAALDRFNRR